MNDENVYKQIIELRKQGRTVKYIRKQLDDIRKQLDNISKNKYYKLLDRALKIEIDKLKKLDWLDENICKELKISKKKFDKLLNYNPSNDKAAASNVMSRSDPKYRRIDNYREFELYRGIIIEAITRANKSEEIFQTKKLSRRINLTQRHMLSIINIDKEKEGITKYMGKLNAIIKNTSKRDNNQTANARKIRNGILGDLEKLNAKINNNFYSKDDQQMINIQKIKNILNDKETNQDIDFIENTIKYNIKMINAKIKEKYNQKKTKLEKDNQVIQIAMINDKRRIKEKIDNFTGDISDDQLKRLKNNLWAIRKTMHIFETNKSSIDQILMKESMEYDPLMFGNNYCHKHTKDFIDIVMEEIDFKWKVENNNRKKKKFNDKHKGKSIELVKHYLLKYMQKPVIEYCIDYSNTLLDEYNFEKVFLEIDMMIPEEKQKEILKKMLKELYSKEIPYSYSDILIQSLLKDIKDENFKKVYKGRKGKRHTSLSQRVADLFYIYDAKKSGVSFVDCGYELVLFYNNLKLNVDGSTVRKLFGTILKFMEEFEEKYKIQPSFLQRRAIV